VINASGAADSNYTINHLIGLLTVTPKEIPNLVWSAPPAINYGVPLGSAQLFVFPTGGVTGSFSFSPPEGTVLDAGIQPLSAVFTPDNTTRYETVSKSVDLTVNPAPLTITAENWARAVGEDNPPFIANYSGFVNGDTVADLDALPLLSTTASSSSPVGAYPIMIGGASDANYAISHIDGNLTVFEPPVAPPLRISRNETGVRVSWDFSEHFKLFSSSNGILWREVEGIQTAGGQSLLRVPEATLSLPPGRMIFRLW